MTDCLPSAFAECLLDSALEPVLDAAVQRGRQAAKRKENGGEAAEVARALLAVTVCDPACGSGSLLVAAAGRIARRVAEARAGSGSPEAQAPDAQAPEAQASEALRRAMREVVAGCIYGVDISAEAVEQAKHRLRAAADVPGMTPPFLDGHVRQGNALMGASPDLIENGIPDEAFRTADGDDPRHARSLRRANARPDPAQATLFSGQGGYSHANEDLAKSLAKTGRPAGGAPGDDCRQAAEYARWRDSAAFRAKRLVADAWCAAFAWAKTPQAPPAIVNRVLLDLRERGAEGIVPETLAEIGRLRGEHRFFHWHLEFPDIFRVPEGETRWRGGFSCVLSAPPRAKIDRRGEPAVFRFAAGSGAYPECAAGLAEPGASALRADHLFTERAMTILAPQGRAGCAVAPGIAAAPGARHLLGGLMRRGALASLYDFPGPGARLCLLTVAGGPVPDGPVRGGPVRGEPVPGRFVPRGPVRDGPVRGGPVRGAPRLAFRLDCPAELGDDGRSFTLTPDEAALVNPNTGGLPPFRGARDAALVTAVYRRVPALWDETRADGNPWRMRLATAPFRPAADGPGAADRLAELGWNWEWLCAWCPPARERPVFDRTVFDRPVADRPVADRIAVAVFLPRAAAAGSLPLMLPRVVPPFAAALIAAQSSLVFEYVARQKIDGPALRAAQWKQLPVPPPDMLEPHLPFIVPRVLELVYTSPDMRPLARDLDDPGDPFAWDPGRRASLRAELDAFFFRLYGIDDRDDVQYITGTLPAGADGRGQDQSQDDGGRPARELILAAYDRMAEADAAGAEYESRVFPPPGHGARHRP